MWKFRFRVLLLLAALGMLVWNIFISISALGMAGFLICGGLWYWLGRRKVLELDAPKG